PHEPDAAKKRAAETSGGAAERAPQRWALAVLGDHAQPEELLPRCLAARGVEQREIQQRHQGAQRKTADRKRIAAQQALDGPINPKLAQARDATTEQRREQKAQKHKNGP